jgi:hypothetical protein
LREVAMARHPAIRIRPPSLRFLPIYGIELLAFESCQITPVIPASRSRPQYLGSIDRVFLPRPLESNLMVVRQPFQIIAIATQTACHSQVNIAHTILSKLV